MAEDTRPSVFISLSACDDRLARALRAAIQDLTADQVRVCYSTLRDSDGGVPAGTDWFDWIVEQVRGAVVTIALLTPASLAKPWLLWETGAVSGASAANNKKRPLHLLLFRVKPEDLPDPLNASRLQATSGDEKVAVRHFLECLLDELEEHNYLRSGSTRRAGARLADAIETYLEEVAAALRTSPIVPTEAAIQEWCARLDGIMQQGRAAEVVHMSNWLDIAFGREQEDRPRPLDARLHRRLGQLYLSAKSYEKAAQQFALTSQLAPRDIFALRIHGEACLKADNPKGALQCIKEIEALDARAFTTDADCAALQGKYHRHIKDEGKARQIYEAAAENLRSSYYIRDLLGHCQLCLGDEAAAEATYGRALNILTELREPSIWAHATAANARLVTGAKDQLVEHLAVIARSSPSPDNIESIERRLLELNELVAPWKRANPASLRVPVMAFY